MYQEVAPTVVRRRMSFPSVFVLSLTAIVISCLASASGVAIYGLRLLDKKSDNVLNLVEKAVGALPEWCEALPPVLADAVHDERSPGYREHLRVSARLAEKGAYRRGCHPVIVEVENQGDEVVSLLSMRLVGMDEAGEPTGEINTWVATPLQVEDEWRGPLLPGETRRFCVPWRHGQAANSITHEITDIRVWREPRPANMAQATSDPA